tara:strand:- start:2371 stop:2616 length:246 start_codon:yes stop_codon:yes gene_type:complete
MKMKNKHLLVREIQIQQKTSGGLLLPKEKWNRIAEVVLVCNDSILKPGDKVIRNVGRSTPIEFNKDQLEMIHEDWIMAKIN